MILSCGQLSRRFYPVGLLAILPLSALGAPNQLDPEYSWAQACKDWTNIPNRLTALGAKHSPFHAGVYSDGAVSLAGPAWCQADRWLLKYRPERLLLSFGYGDPPDFNHNPQEQWLAEGDMPVVVTKVVPSSGGRNHCEHQESVLVHLLRTQEAKTGREPLILRARIEARNPRPEATRAVVWVQLNGFDHKSGVDPNGDMLAFGSRDPKRVPYEGGTLQLDGDCLRSSAGRLRALIHAPEESRISLHQRNDLPEDTPAWKALRERELLENLVRVEFPLSGNRTAIVRLTVPVYPLDKEQSAALLADDFASAWERTLAFWQKELDRAVDISVPEPVFHGGLPTLQ